MATPRTLRFSLLVLAAAAAVCWTAPRAWGIGFILEETKGELNLEYDLSVTDHGTGRVTIVFTLADEGRLKPLDEVQLVIPGQKKNADGGHWMDLVVSIDMTEMDGGKRVGRIHIAKALAERAQLWLNTHTMDGKMDPLTRLHHVIPLANYLHNVQEAAAKPGASSSTKQAAPATEPKRD